jgi:hypothetical protein
MVNVVGDHSPAGFIAEGIEGERFLETMMSIIFKCLVHLVISLLTKLNHGLIRHL